MTDPTASNPLPESPGPTVRLSHPILTAVPTFAGQFAAGATAAAARKSFKPGQTPKDFWEMTLRPEGPSVTRTASARRVTPAVIRWRASLS